MTSDSHNRHAPTTPVHPVGSGGGAPVDIAGKLAVVAIDAGHARVYAIEAEPNTAMETITAPDPSHVNHNIFHRHGNPSGAFDVDGAETTAYFKALAHALAPARGLLLVGHGKGKANFSHHFESFLEKHHRDVAAKIVANVRADIDDITDRQLLRLGEHHFHIEVPRRA
jgi:hypothetical protein